MARRFGCSPICPTSDITHATGTTQGTLIWGSELSDERPAMVGALAIG